MARTYRLLAEAPEMPSATLAHEQLNAGHLAQVSKDCVRDVCASVDASQRALRQGMSSSAEVIAECVSLLQSSKAECDAESAEGVFIVDVPPEAVGTAWQQDGMPRGQAEWSVPVTCCDTKRRLVYLHGGSFRRYSASHPIYRAWASQLAIATGLPVLCIDYSLVPEHPAPQAIHDVLAAVDYAWDHGPNGPEPAQHIILGGDSAGGGLVFASFAASVLGEVAPGVAVRPSRSGRAQRPPSALWGISAWTDLTCSQGSYDSRAWDELNRRGDPIYTLPSVEERSRQAAHAGTA